MVLFSIFSSSHHAVVRGFLFPLAAPPPPHEQHTNQSGPSLINIDFIERTNAKLVRCHTAEASITTRMKKNQTKLKKQKQKHQNPKTPQNRTNENTPDQTA